VEQKSREEKLLHSSNSCSPSIIILEGRCPENYNSEARAGARWTLWRGHGGQFKTSSVGFCRHSAGLLHRRRRRRCRPRVEIFLKISQVLRQFWSLPGGRNSEARTGWTGRKEEDGRLVFDVMFSPVARGQEPGRFPPDSQVLRGGESPARCLGPRKGEVSGARDGRDRGKESRRSSCFPFQTGRS